MNDFTKDMANALFNQDKINDLFRQKLQQAVNDPLKRNIGGIEINAEELI